MTQWYALRACLLSFLQKQCILWVTTLAKFTLLFGMGGRRGQFDTLQKVLPPPTTMIVSIFIWDAIKVLGASDINLLQLNEPFQTEQIHTWANNSHDRYLSATHNYMQRKQERSGNDRRGTERSRRGDQYFTRSKECVYTCKTISYCISIAYINYEQHQRFCTMT